MKLNDFNLKNYKNCQKFYNHGTTFSVNFLSLSRPPRRRTPQSSIASSNFEWSRLEKLFTKLLLWPFKI